MNNEISRELIEDFKSSRDTLRIYQEGKCIFRSDKDVLAPLVEFISQKQSNDGNLTVLDKVTGNAAALLAVKAGAKEVFAPLGSEFGRKSLEKHQVRYQLEQVVPFILARNGVDICPMEKLSLDKTPDEFYEAVKTRFLHSC